MPRLRTALVLPVVALTLLAGCAAETEETPTVTETATATETATTEPEQPSVIALPDECDFAFSDAQYGAFISDGLALNPDFMSQDPQESFGAMAIASTVISLDPAVCVWTPPTPSGFAIFVGYAEIGDELASIAESDLLDLGFSSTAVDAGVIYDTVYPPEEGEGIEEGYSEAHFFGMGVWVGVYAWNESSALTTITEMVPYLASGDAGA